MTTRRSPAAHRREPGPRKPRRAQARVRLGVGDRVRGGLARARFRRLPKLLTRPRVGGLLGMILAGLLLRVVTEPSAFGVTAVEQPALRWTTSDAVLATVQLPPGTNLFAVKTRPIEDRLRSLPGVASARVAVALPGTLAITVDERAPILAWRAGGKTYLVDREGVLFAELQPTSVAESKVPTIVDDRTSVIPPLAVGSRLDPVDLDAATRLGALAPADLGSGAQRLQVRLDPQDGFVVGTAPATWTAIFGFYSPELRSTGLIPGQVRLLGSLLVGREASVARVLLPDDVNGTYVPKPTPKASSK